MEPQNGKSRREEVCPEKKDKLDLATARACIAQTKGPEYWRSLEELAGSAEFHEMMHREFPKGASRSEEHTSELQSRPHLVCRLLLEKKKKKKSNEDENRTILVMRSNLCASGYDVDRTE